MMSGTATPGPDLSLCAAEPIHIPGAIQPHGALLALEPATLCVRQVSDNVEHVLGIPLERLLQSRAEEWLGAAQAAEVLQRLTAAEPQGANPLCLRIGTAEFDGLLHRVDGAGVLELEPRSVAQADEVHGAELQRVLARLAAAASMPLLLDAVAQTVRELTGFDRVMVYRFDEDEHGEVVAEARANDMEAFLGLHYPESDIPRQARELYLRNWLRAIPDAVYQPARLIPAVSPHSHAPLDLSQSVLRSVSPIHLEYLANMGVRASMSVSLIVEGRLWGLITCGHRQPRFLPYRRRSVCETIGRIVSVQITALEVLERRREQDATTRDVEHFASFMRAAGDEVLGGCHAAGGMLLQLVHATGAAVLTGHGIDCLGEAPGQDDIALLGEWVQQRCDPQGVFHTHQLGHEDARFGHLSPRVSGVLAFMMPTLTPQPRGVLWFRPEQVETVRWGGNPGEVAHAGAQGGPARLHPRRSFELWKEVVRQRSVRWEPAALHAAAQLRRSAIEADLLRQLAREKAAVRAREDLVAVVSHDLRNPMSVVVLQAALLERQLTLDATEASRRIRASLHAIRNASQRMNSLLGDLLKLAKIEAGRYEVVPARLVVDEALQDTVELLHLLGQAKDVRLVFEPAPGLVVLADAERLFQVFSNLIGNAVKHSPEHSTVRIGARQVHDMCEFWVTDEGGGVDATQLPHLFERYWQVRRSDHSGAGLGLYISKGIVEAHGGTITAESEPGKGATFRFRLPMG